MPHAAIHWFEIPVTDLDRAQRFYEAVLGQPLRRETLGPPGQGPTLAVLPYEAPGCGGALFLPPAGSAGSAGLRPADVGSLVYLNVNPSLEAAIERALAAGGTLALAKVELPEGRGAFAHLRDTEGNRIGLHADGAA